MALAFFLYASSAIARRDVLSVVALPIAAVGIWFAAMLT
jgi:hypothetical protein